MKTDLERFQMALDVYIRVGMPLLIKDEGSLFSVYAPKGYFDHLKDIQKNVLNELGAAYHYIGFEVLSDESLQFKFNNPKNEIAKNRTSNKMLSAKRVRRMKFLELVKRQIDFAAHLGEEYTEINLVEQDGEIRTAGRGSELFVSKDLAFLDEMGYAIELERVLEMSERNQFDQWTMTPTNQYILRISWSETINEKES